MVIVRDIADAAEQEPKTTRAPTQTDGSAPCGRAPGPRCGRGP